MYTFPYYKEKDQQKVFDFMKQNPFAFLIANGHSYPAATQVPFLMEEREGQLYLTAHIMRNTDHHNAIIADPNVLCIFTGAHSYVSASWYSDPKVASTWNYMSVHASGKLKFLNDEQLIEVLKATTTHFESDANSPASFENLPHEYVQKLSKAIVAFEIAVEKIEHVFKLSQNRDQQSYENIIHKLDKGDHNEKAIACEMNKRSGELFK